MRRLLLLAASSLLLFAFRTNAPLTLPKEPIAPKLEAPTDPKVGDVNLVSSRIPAGNPVDAKVIFTGGKTNDCALYLAKKEIIFFFDKDGSPYKKSVAVPAIASIEFLQWKGYRQEDKTTWIFYPIRTKVTLRDGLSFECSYYIEDFGKLGCVDRVGQTTLYAYYYDYRENGVWKNCKRKDKSWPETHQPVRVLKRIIFL